MAQLNIDRFSLDLGWSAQYVASRGRSSSHGRYRCRSRLRRTGVILVPWTSAISKFGGLRIGYLRHLQIKALRNVVRHFCCFEKYDILINNVKIILTHFSFIKNYIVKDIFIIKNIYSYIVSFFELGFKSINKK